MILKVLEVCGAVIVMAMTIAIVVVIIESMKNAVKKSKDKGSD